MAKPRRSNEVSVTVGGVKRRLHLNAYGLMLAMEQGFSLDELAAGTDDPAAQFKTTLRLLWIGLLPYESGLSFEEVARLVEFDELEGVTAALAKAQARQTGGMPDPLAQAVATVAE